MSNDREITQMVQRLEVEIKGIDQVVVTHLGTSDVVVNLVASPGGLNVIYHDQSLTEEQAVAVAILVLIKENEDLHYLTLSDL